MIDLICIVCELKKSNQGTGQTIFKKTMKKYNRTKKVTILGLAGLATNISVRPEKKLGNSFLEMHSGK
jgi:hypothetical protein